MDKKFPLSREEATELYNHLIAIHALYERSKESSLLNAPYDYMDWRCALVDINNYIRRIDESHLGEPEAWKEARERG